MLLKGRVDGQQVFLGTGPIECLHGLLQGPLSEWSRGQLRGVVVPGVAEVEQILLTQDVGPAQLQPPARLDDTLMVLRHPKLGEEARDGEGWFSAAPTWRCAAFGLCY